MKYRPEVDGLRSLAVVPVILFHAGYSLFSGGYVGVDVFFVISGYLITKIIASELEAGTFTIADFYVRRAKRILPALIVVILATIPFAWMWMIPSEFKDFAQSIAAQGVFSSNILFWLESDYFAAASELKPLLHTWSLAVEEQYYIFFPLLMMLLFKRPRVMVSVFIAIWVSSLVLTEILVTRAPEANFYLLPSRAWELLTGAACALVQLRLGSRIRPNNIWATLGFALIVVPIFVFDKHTPFPSVYALFPVIGSALIILFALQGTIVGKLLSASPLVFIGLISYSAYLWHQPVFALARIYSPYEPSHMVMGALAALSFVLAYLSWKYVEQPGRRVKWSRIRILQVAGTVSVCLCVSGAILSKGSFQKHYFYKHVPEQNHQVVSQIELMRTMDHAKLFDDGECKFRIRDYSQESQQRFDKCFSRFGRAVAIFGDSHSEDIYQSLARTSAPPFTISLSQNKCRPHIEGTTCNESDLTRFFNTNTDKIRLGIYTQAGFWLLQDKNGMEGGRSIFDEENPVAEVDEMKIKRVFSFLEEVNSQFPVLWLGPRFEPHVAFERLVKTSCEQEHSWLKPSASHISIFDHLDKYITENSKHYKFKYASIQKILKYNVLTDYYNCNTLYWSDGDHWSPEGEVYFGKKIVTHLNNWLQESDLSMRN